MSLPKRFWQCKECGAPIIKATPTSVMAVCYNGCGKLKPLGSRDGQKMLSATGVEKVRRLPVVELAEVEHRGCPTVGAVINGQKLVYIKSRPTKDGILVRTKDWVVVRLHRPDGKPAELKCDQNDKTQLHVDLLLQNEV